MGGCPCTLARCLSEYERHACGRPRRPSACNSYSARPCLQRSRPGKLALEDERAVIRCDELDCDVDALRRRHRDRRLDTRCKSGVEHPFQISEDRVLDAPEVRRNRRQRLHEVLRAAAVVARFVWLALVAPPLEMRSLVAAAVVLIATEKR